VRAVIFDLWDTLVLWPVDSATDLNERLAERLGVEPERFARAWDAARPARSVGPLLESVREVLAELGTNGAGAEEVAALRLEHTRRVLRPREGALETLGELRRRGLRLGLISVCSEDVVQAWDETELAPLFDTAVFSCSVGLSKPDPRIYELAAEELGVPPEECLFVGDGANDELAGAERAGMRAALILRPGEEEPLWPEAQAWRGPRLRALPEVPALVDRLAQP
jgi:putative hydrolase of the HAD superfamily